MQARRLLASLAPIGSKVNLRMVTTDRYGRSVAEVVKANQNLNLLMVRHGQAFAYRQYWGCPGFKDKSIRVTP
jgi:micrococcal nuclease